MAFPSLPLSCGDGPPFTIFIGIDFGTTFSGFAFALGRQSDEIRVQPQAGANSRKVPTAVLLNSDLELLAFGQDAYSKYFDEAEEAEDEGWLFFDRFKMSLHRDQNVNDSTPIRAANGQEVPAIVVFARSLEYFVKTAKEEIPRASGVPLHPEEVKWTVTVPAIWGERAKLFMRQVAMEAGIRSQFGDENLEVALEPEAAALCCRGDLQNVWQALCKPDTLRYIVIDCGGGTVDITVHDLCMLGENVGKIKEVEPASGDAWGGTLVDKNLEDILRRFFGHSISSKINESMWVQFSRNKLEEGKRLKDSAAKSAIDLTTDMHVLIQSSGGISSESQEKNGLSYRARNGKIIVDRAVLEDCYTEPIEKITDHVRRVVERCGSINAMLVVGGFAECSLLIKRIEEEFQRDDCRVIRPPNCSLAVAKGAVLFAQNPKLIQSRVARFSYGIEASVPFEDGRHQLARRVEEGGRAFCHNIFVPYVYEGDAIQMGSTVERLINPRKATQRGMKLVLYCSPHRDVQYTDEPGCRKLLQLRIDMPQVDEGSSRIVKTIVDFSQTSIRFSAIDQSSGQRADTKIEYQID